LVSWENPWFPVDFPLNQSIEGIVPPVSAEEAPDLITGSALHAARRLRQQGAKFGLDGEQMVGLPAKMLGLPA